MNTFSSLRYAHPPTTHNTAIGAFGAPLVCQSIVATGIRWANFYFGSLVLSAINTSLLVFAFCPTRSELLRDADFAWALLRSAPPSPDAATVATKETAQASPTQSIAPILQKKTSVGPRSECRTRERGEGGELTSVRLAAYSAAVRKPKLWASAIFSMIYTGRYAFVPLFVLQLLVAHVVRHPARARRKVSYVTVLPVAPILLPA